MKKEEIVKLFINTIVKIAPEKLDEYIEKIKRNSHSSK